MDKLTEELGDKAKSVEDVLSYALFPAVALQFFAEREAGKNPVAAWGAIVEDPERSKAYRQARGKAGWRA